MGTILLSFCKPSRGPISTILTLPLWDDVKKTFNNGGLSFGVFSEIHKNPVKSDVLNGCKVFKEGQHDSLIGFGGGASMDVARAMALACW